MSLFKNPASEFVEPKKISYISNVFPEMKHGKIEKYSYKMVVDGAWIGVSDVKPDVVHLHRNDIIKSTKLFYRFINWFKGIA